MPWATSRGLVAAALLAAGAGDPEALLQRSDVAAFAPDSFTASVVLKDPEGKTVNLVLFHSGLGRTLLKFLDPPDRGKYLLKTSGTLYFLSPRAKAPVKLEGAYRLVGGATVDDLLGTSYSRDFEVLGSGEVKGVFTLDLKAKSPLARCPRALYAVDLGKERPLRIECETAAGHPLDTVRFLSWTETPRPVPREISVESATKAGSIVTIVVEGVRERAIPDALFDPLDGRARAELKDASPLP